MQTVHQEGREWLWGLGLVPVDSYLRMMGVLKTENRLLFARGSDGAIVEATVVQLRLDTLLTQEYHQIAERRGKGRAKVAAALL